jgi:hypothetical protein
LPRLLVVLDQPLGEGPREAQRQLAVRVALEQLGRELQALEHAQDAPRLRLLAEALEQRRVREPRARGARQLLGQARAARARLLRPARREDGEQARSSRGLHATARAARGSAPAARAPWFFPSVALRRRSMAILPRSSSVGVERAHRSARRAR